MNVREEKRGGCLRHESLNEIITVLSAAFEYFSDSAIKYPNSYTPTRFP